jgi:hypothetical protein
MIGGTDTRAADEVGGGGKDHTTRQRRRQIFL